MKRIISLLITVCLLFSCVVSVSAQTTIDSLEAAERFAIAFGLADSGNYVPTERITRAQFAQIIATLLNHSDVDNEYDKWYNNNFTPVNNDEQIVPENTRIFYDVDSSLKEYKAIQFVSSMGYMSGISTNYFGPSYEITLSEAIKVFVSLLGYGSVAKDEGGYPDGYMNVAKSIKILNGVGKAKNDFITYKDCFDIIYNMLDVKPLVFEGISSEGVNLEKGEDTFLSLGLELISVSGTVEDNGITTISGAACAGVDYVVIDGIKMKLGNCTYVRSYIGREVEAYYEVNSSGIATLKYAELCDDNSITFSSLDYISWNNSLISYADKNGKIKTAGLVSPNRVTVIYNGKALSTYSRDILDFPYGDITLVSTTGSKYDVIIIRDYMVGKVEKTVKDTQTIYSDVLYKSMNSLKTLSLDDCDICLINDSAGNVVSFEEIPVGSVVSAIVSKDKEYIELIVSNTKVADYVITSGTEDADSITITDGKSEYFFEKRSELSSNPIIKYGNTYILYLDFDGRLAFIEEQTESVSLRKGFITDVADVSNGLTSEYKIRMYTEDGTLNTYSFGHKVVLNHNKIKTEEAFGAIETAKSAQKVVLFGANDKTQIISEIVLPLGFGDEDIDNRGWYEISPAMQLSKPESMSESLWNTHVSSNQYKWFVNGNVFNKLVYFDKANTLAMCVPPEETNFDNEKLYTVTKGIVPFEDGGFYLINGYSTNPNSVIAEVVSYASATLASASVNDRTFAVVEKIVTAADEDGEPYTKIKAQMLSLDISGATPVELKWIEDTSYFTTFSKEEAVPTVRVIPGDTYGGPTRISELSPGDIIRYTTNAIGELTAVCVVFDESKGRPFDGYEDGMNGSGSAVTRPYIARTGIHVGYPLTVTGNGIRLSNAYHPGELSANNEDMFYATAEEQLPHNVMALPAETYRQDLLKFHKLFAHDTRGKTVLVVETDSRGITKVRTGSVNDIIPYELSGQQDKYEKVVGVVYFGLTIGTVIYKY